MRKASEEQEFEQAAQYRNKLKAVRSLLERQRISNAPVGTLDAIAVAAEGTDANAQVFQIRDGVLADRQSFYLENAAQREEGEVAEEFILQYYASAIAVPPQVVVQQSVSDIDALSGRAHRAARRAGRGPPRRARRQAPHPRAGRAQRAGSPSTRTASAPSGAARSGSRRSTGSSARSAWSRSRCGSSASTSPT